MTSWILTRISWSKTTMIMQIVVTIITSMARTATTGMTISMVTSTLNLCNS
jgi:hypothetical protein